MALATPPGYTRLVPLDSSAHRGLGIEETRRYSFAAGLSVIYVTVTEFFAAAREFPVAFGFDARRNEYLPVAVTGLDGEHNLFVELDGSWRPGTYVPAYVRRYPFYTVAIDTARPDGADTVVCVDEPALSNTAPPLFDSSGEPTAEWKRRKGLVDEVESAQRQTRTFARALAHLELFESFHAHASPRTGNPVHLSGLYRVNEKKLNALPARSLKSLMSRGYLARVYGHLISLDNFARLLDLHAARSNHSR